MRVDDYLKRIRQPAPLAASVDAVHALHRTHREAFLFENLSIQTGRGISLALCDLERKFLDEGRGGYCFEHNTLVTAVLPEIRVARAALLGRVPRTPPHPPSPPHPVLPTPTTTTSLP